MHTEFWFGNLKERDSLEDLGADEAIILKRALRKDGRCELDSSDSGLDQKRRAVVNMVMNRRVPRTTGKSLAAR